MKILLTNDDGLQAPGINRLYQVLKEKHTVYTVAPEKEMSATGHAITLHKPLRVKEVELEAGVARAVNGTPSDCVKLALEAILPSPPDLVISGINSGPNLGNDVFYSGTVSAAVEGFFLGYPSLAVSLVLEGEFRDFSFGANYINELLAKHGSKILEEKYLLNINFPPRPAEQIQGTKITKLSRRNYANVFDQRVDPRGQKYYWMTGSIEEMDEKDSDTMAIREGYVSITPLCVDLTSHEEIPELKKLNW